MENRQETMNIESNVSLSGKLKHAHCVYIFNSNLNFAVRCPLSGCSTIIERKLDVFRSHARLAHMIKTSVKNDIPIECTECRKTYAYFQDFTRHVFSYHTIPSAELTEPQSVSSASLPEDMEIQINANVQEAECNNENPSLFPVRYATHIGVSN